MSLNPLKSGHCFNGRANRSGVDYGRRLNPLKSGHCFNRVKVRNSEEEKLS